MRGTSSLRHWGQSRFACSTVRKPGNTLASPPARRVKPNPPLKRSTDVGDTPLDVVRVVRVARTGASSLVADGAHAARSPLRAPGSARHRER
jgi:hypothetical protein